MRRIFLCLFRTIKNICLWVIITILYFHSILFVMEYTPSINVDTLTTWISKAFYGYPFTCEDIHSLCEEVRELLF